ncbi:MAG: AI-2E family transporter [Rhodospirillales bacterium]|nr:AI-2E family transporter [Rhodospirillales bacterium]MSP80411.1 AI-2E family transporter [Rhodospirillales bacterium]
MNRRTVFILAAIGGSGLLLYLLSGVLLPFVAGLLVAYFLDPVANRLERMGCSRTLATSAITLSFFVLVGTAAALLLPLLQGQVMGLVAKAPAVIAAFREQAEPLLERLQATLTEEQVARLRDAAGSYAGEAARLLGSLIGRVMSGGAAFFQILSLLVITPLVSFYLLRDWDRIVTRFDELMPRDIAPVVRVQMGEIDRTIAAWVRGQATVCVLLGAWYGIGLTLIGLEFGLGVGFLTGLISFVPYFGMGLGLMVALGIAFAQFTGVVPFALVVGVFAAGQVVDAYLLTPRLVGEKVGLHPVWVIFALLAGGALFGFTGVLLAVPVAAVIGVLVRYAIVRYRESSYYQGGGGSR